MTELQLLLLFAPTSVSLMIATTLTWPLSPSYFSGAKKLIEKIKEFNPKIAVFNGKGIYEVFSGEKEFIFGKQPEKIGDTDTVHIILIYI